MSRIQQCHHRGKVVQKRGRNVKQFMVVESQWSQTAATKNGYKFTYSKGVQPVGERLAKLIYTIYITYRNPEW